MVKPKKGQKRSKPSADAADAVKKAGKKEEPQESVPLADNPFAQAVDSPAANDSDDDGARGLFATYIPPTDPKVARELAKARKDKADAKAEANKKRHKHLSHLSGVVDEEERRRTIFVGNLPNAVKSKDVSKLFKECGDVDSVRVRCIKLKEPGEGNTRGRGVRILRKEHKEDEELSSNAYVVFKSGGAVNTALGKNGLLFQGKHIVVTKEDAKAKLFPPSTSLFIGNLPYRASDESVRQFFVDNGVPSVERVRIVRDPKTGEGRGIGYVQFSSRAALSHAMALKGAELNGREVRLTHVQKPKVKEQRELTRREQRQLDQMRMKKQGKLEGDDVTLDDGSDSKKRKRARSADWAAKKKGTGISTVDPTISMLEDAPAWMGRVTNARKKLDKDIRWLSLHPDERKQKRKDAIKRNKTAAKRSEAKKAGDKKGGVAKGGAKKVKGGLGQKPKKRG